MISSTRPWALRFKTVAHLIVLCEAIALTGCLTWGDERPPPETAQTLDLERYAGTWHEIARLPFRVQEGCHGTTATYSLKEDGTVEVINRCREDSCTGEVDEAKGKAWRPAPDEPAKLKVQFFWPFSGGYWVLALDEEYQWSLVGTPDREYLWILARRPELPPETYQRIVKIAEAQGYPVDDLLVTPQCLKW